MYKYEFIVIYKFIQFLLCHDIALCISDSNSWRRHASANQTEQFLNIKPRENKARILFLPSDSYENNRPVGVELLQQAPKNKGTKTIVPKIIKEQAYVATGKLETKKLLPLFKVTLETKNFKIFPSPNPFTTITAGIPNRTIVSSKNTSSKEKKQLNTTTMQTFYKKEVRRFSGTKDKVLSEKIDKITKAAGTTTAKDTLLNGLQKPTTIGHTSKTTRAMSSTASKSTFMYFNETSKAKNTEKSQTTSIHVHNVNDIPFVDNKAAVNPMFRSKALISRKKQIAKILVDAAKNKNLFRSINGPKLVKSTNRTKVVTKAKTANRSQIDLSLSDFSELHPHIIAKQLMCLEKKMKSRMQITQEIIGRTAGYNDIVLWKLKELGDYRRSKKPACNDKVADKEKFVEDEPEKRIIFIVHGLSVMGQSRFTCFRYIYDFDTLLSYYADNLDAFDIYLLPMANPDGVSKVMDSTMWNKNLSPQSACPGVNVDRNFDVAWNESLNVSSCSQLYPGPHPFSEQESSAVKNILHKYGHKIIGYFHFHLGEYNSDTLKGDAVLYPRGYTEDRGDDDRYLDLRTEIDEAMKNMSFKALSVTVDTLYSWYGKISGSSVDYASTVYGVPYALELIMQLYSSDQLTEASLTEVWQNIFDVIFDHIARSQKQKDGYESIKDDVNDNQECNDKKQEGCHDEKNAGDAENKGTDDDDKKGNKDSKESDSSDKKNENNDKKGKDCNKSDFTLRKGKVSNTIDKEEDDYFENSDESD